MIQKDKKTSEKTGKKKLFIDKTVKINASASKVWDVLTKSEYTNKWVNEFAPGMTLVSNWKLWSPVLWVDINWKVVVEWNVTKVEPGKFLRFTVFDIELGRHNVTEEDGMTFELKSKDNKTNLHLIHGDFSVLEDGNEYYEMTLDAWNKILPIIKELAEEDDKKIEIIHIDKDIKVICVTAKSFPWWVMDAHEELHSQVPFPMKRKYFWISYWDENGEIVYKAAIEEEYDWEADEFGYETFTIKKGDYINRTVKDFMRDIQDIGITFKELLANPEVDPNGYCLEWYFNDTDVRCMVLLKSK